MPRPMKWRRICAMPNYNRYGPLHDDNFNSEIIKLSLDEYECLRLIDLEGLTQEECSEQMQVGRTTVQAIYQQARKKVADSLVNQKVIFIDGGEVKLCDDKAWCYERAFRHHGQHHCPNQKRK